MHRESVYLCTYDHGTERIVGCVRAWDGREAAQLFSLDLQSELPDAEARDVTVSPSRGTGTGPLRARGGDGRRRVRRGTAPRAPDRNSGSRAPSSMSTGPNRS